MSAWNRHKVEAAWTTDPDVASPAWVDITADVDGDVVIVKGRQVEGQDITPTVCSFGLHNETHKYTAGNRLSPLYPNVRRTKMIRVTDTIGGVIYYRFVGYINTIDPGTFSDIGVVQTMTITATDRLDRLATLPAYTSTLGAQVLGAANSALRYYWALTEGAGALSAFPSVQTGTGDASLTLTVIRGSFTGVPYQSPPYIDFGSQPGPLGDDGSYPVFNTQNNGSFIVTGPILKCVNGSINLPVLAYRYVGFTMWYMPQAANAANPSIMSFTNSAFDRLFGLALFGGLSALKYQLAVGIGPSGIAAVDSGPPKWGCWQLLAGRWDTVTGAVRFWVDDDQFTGTTGGPVTTSGPFSQIYINSGAPAESAGQMQIYASNTATDFDQTYVLAQFQAGLAGFERQSTGQRITTLAGFADIPTSQLDIDTGTTLMPVAALSGLTPAAAMLAAATAENGDLFVTGNNVLTFNQRTRRYTAPIACHIPRQWLSRDVTHRDDQPLINTSSVTANGTTTARAVNAVSVQQYGASNGAGLGDVGLQLANAAEAADRANWLVYNGSIPRTRVTSLPINLIIRSVGDCQQILDLDIGSRVALTAMPATTPEGATDLIIEGLTERIGPLNRTIEFVTSPVLGATPGTPDHWFTWDVDSWDGPSLWAY